MLPLNETVTLLESDRLLHTDMLEPIRRNQAELVYAENDGVLLREKRGGAYMLTAAEVPAGERLLGLVPRNALFVAHQPYQVQLAQERLGLRLWMNCIQAVYLADTGLAAPEGAVIKPLTLAECAMVREHYLVEVDTAYIHGLITRGELFGYYCGDYLAGFAGIHDEGSIGLLEVFPEFRRRGVGAALESYMVNWVLDRGWTPFCQVEEGNETSLMLQRKLGFTFSETRIAWMH